MLHSKQWVNDMQEMYDLLVINTYTSQLHVMNNPLDRLALQKVSEFMNSCIQHCNKFPSQSGKLLHPSETPSKSNTQVMNNVSMNMGYFVQSKKRDQYPRKHAKHWQISLKIFSHKNSHLTHAMVLSDGLMHVSLPGRWSFVSVGRDVTTI